MTFSEAVDQVAHHSETEQGRRMTVADIATRIGRNENYLRKATSQYDDAHPLRADLVAPLTVATRNYALVEHIAEACGGVFFRLPPVHATSADVIEQTATTVKEFADVLHSSADAYADQRLTPEEAQRTCREIDQAIAALAQFRKLITDAATPTLRVAKGA